MDAGVSAFARLKTELTGTKTPSRTSLTQHKQNSSPARATPSLFFTLVPSCSRAPTAHGSGIGIASSLAAARNPVPSSQPSAASNAANETLMPRVILASIGPNLRRE